MRKTSVMFKLSLLFMLIMIPIIVTGVISLTTANRRLSQQMQSSILDTVVAAACKLDEQLSQSHELAGTLLSDSRVRRLSNPRELRSDYERIVDVNIVRDLLTNVKRSNPLILNVRLYFPYAHIAYNADQYALGSRQEITDTQYAELLALRTTPAMVHWFDGRLSMFRYSSLSNPACIAEVELSMDSLKQTLASFGIYDDAHYLLKLPGQQVRITDLTDEAFLLQLSELAAEDVVKVQYNDRFYYAFCARMTDAGAELMQVVPETFLFEPMRLSSLYTAAFALTVTLCFIVLLAGAYRLIHKPLKQLVNGFNSVEKKGLDVHIATPESADFAYLYDGFNSMVASLDDMVKREYQNKLTLQRAELKQLQAQINPHFLYNSFFMLRQLIDYGQQEEASAVAQSLGSYFEYITRNRSDEVTLGDEYAHAHIYADLQAERFRGRITVEMDSLAEEWSRLIVPKLILQPILENTFQHGLESKVSDGLLRVRLTAMPGLLLIDVEDNGDNCTDETLSMLSQQLQQAQDSVYDGEWTGLINIAKRLQLFYQRTDSITVRRSELGGLMVRLALPLEGEVKS